MKARHIVLATALLAGLVLSTSAFAASPAASSPASSRLKLDAPAPANIVAPIGLPRAFEGVTVTLSLTIDEMGRPHNIKVVSRGDQDLAPYLIAAISHWEFTPARRNGVAVATKVLMPIELVDS
jgi:TonB family protein